MSKLCSRRDFLRVASLGATGVLLAACQAKVVEVTKVVERVVKETVIVEGEVKTVEKIVKETVVVEKIVDKEPAAPKEKVVRILMPSWAVGEIPFDTTAREFSSATEGVEIKVQTTFEGWDTKVRAQQADGSLEWNAAGIASSASSSLPQWILSKLIQPMDDYIEASKQEGADQLVSDMIPTLRNASIHEGKFYGIPYSFENITFNWRTDYYRAVGVTESPETWDDLLEVSLALKKWGASEQIYPVSFIPDLDASVGAFIYSALDVPFDDDELLKWESPEALDALRFYKKLVVEEELTPPHGFDGYLDAYWSGKVAALQAQSSRGVWGQLAFGTDKITTSKIPTYAKGSGVGTPFWGNCTGLLTGAPYPQETMDYLIYTMGPQNVAFQKIVIKSGKTPVYESIYNNVIKTDPQFRIYQWMIAMRDEVNRSYVRPFNNYFSIQDSFYKKHIVIFTEPGSTMSAEECAQLILKDSREEIAKQKL